MSLSQLYEKSMKKVSGVYIQTKQNSIKFLSTLNINIANKSNENTEIERKSNNLESKDTKCLDSKPAFFNPLTPYQIETYHKFISDSTEYYNNEDYDVSNTNSPISNPNSAYSMYSPLYKNNAYGQFSPFTRNPNPRKSPCSVNEKDLSDQESSDEDDYFSRQRSNYSSQSSSSSVSSANYGINELALTPLSIDKNDEGYEIINEEEIKYIEREKVKDKNLKRRKSTMKSISSQKSDKSISIKPRKSISKLSLKLNKKKSSSSTTDSVGTINFEEFISSLDISEDVEDRLQWLFRFYDNDGDGFITRDEMLQIMHTLYN